MFPGLNLTIRLHDGEVVQLTVEAQEAVYERLWRQSRRGSIMAALKLRDTHHGNTERLVRLNEQETVAFREAVRHVGGE